MEHQLLILIDGWAYMEIAPRQATTERQRDRLGLLALVDKLPLRIPSKISFDLTTYEAAQLFGGGN